MTTGRINQVTCVGLALIKEPSPNKSILSNRSVFKLQVRLNQNQFPSRTFRLDTWQRYPLLQE